MENEKPKKNFHILLRNPINYVRETKYDIHKIERRKNNLPNFKKEREYVAALNASKIERMLAKPFIGELKSGVDEVRVTACDPTDLSLSSFGTADGIIQYWNVSKRFMLKQVRCHEGFINGLSYFKHAKFITVGNDKHVKQWDFQNVSNSTRSTITINPKHSFAIDNVPNYVDCQQRDTHFAIATSENILLFNRDCLSTEPIYIYGQRERESVRQVKFHPTETNIFSGLMGNNKIMLFDARQPQSTGEIAMKFGSNSMSFNPQSPYYFSTASFDFNCYSFDMRHMIKPCRVHKGHTKAVTDISYSNKGHEFVTGSIDQSIRIFRSNDNISREFITMKRMSRLLSVRYTCDDNFILSSSDDMTVRLWKANAAAKLSVMNSREKAAYNDSQQLRDKYAHNDEMKRIQNRRYVPKAIKALSTEHNVIQKKLIRKERNIIQNTKGKNFQKQTKFTRALADK